MNTGYVARLVKSGETCFEILTNGFDADTKFELASVSKQFTAAAVLKLRSEGGISVVNDLLLHTSGVADVYEFIEKLQAAGLSVPPISNENIPKFVELAGGYRAGMIGVYEYSNTGYDLLGSLIDENGGYYECIINMLGRNMYPIFGSSSSQRYQYNYLTSEYLVAPEHPMDGVYGSGGVSASLNDMTAWVQTEHYKNLLEQTPLVGLYRDRDRIGHSGEWRGATAASWFYPEHDAHIFAMANSDQYDADECVLQIAREYL